METGILTLRNTRRYPFNNSAVLVPLKTERLDTSFRVAVELLRSDGDAGDIRVTGRAVNGFEIAYTGSAAWAEVQYWVMDE